jgi:hypothetical protein
MADLTTCADGRIWPLTCQYGCFSRSGRFFTSPGRSRDECGTNAESRRGVAYGIKSCFEVRSLSGSRANWQTRSLREPQPGGVPGPPGCSRGAMADVVADYEATNGSRSSIWHTAVAAAASIAAPMASSGSVGTITTALRVPARLLSAKLL